MITATPSSGRLGPGSRVYLTCTSPTVNYMQASLADFTLGGNGINGQEYSGLAGDTQVQLGYVNSPIVANKLDSYGGQNGLADGHAVTLLVSAWDASAGFLESNPFTGYLWDAVSQAPALLGRVVEMVLAGSGGFTSADRTTLGQVLANTEGGSFKSPFIGVAQSSLYTGNPINGGTTYDLVPPTALAVLGLTWQAVTTPDYVGGEIGVITEVKRRVIQAIVFHTLLGGVTFADQTFDSRGVTGTCWFDSPNPTSVSVFAWPGFQLNLSWLIIL